MRIHQLITPPNCVSHAPPFTCSATVRAEPTFDHDHTFAHRQYLLVQVRASTTSRYYRLQRPTVVLFFIPPEAALLIDEQDGDFYCAVYADLTISELRLVIDHEDQTRAGVSLEVWCNHNQHLHCSILVAPLVESIH